MSHFLHLIILDIRFGKLHVYQVWQITCVWEKLLLLTIRCNEQLTHAALSPPVRNKATKELTVVCGRS